jgi:hypothetical protein
LIDSSHVSNQVECEGVKPETVAGDASREVWAYLLGLYFTDGSLCHTWKTCWRVSFYLASDEAELVERVARYLRSFGRTPHVRPPKSRNYFTVRFSGSRSPPPFPDKKQFLSGGDAWTWLSSEGLDDEFAVPFIAGLLDGDGYCRASFHGKGALGHVDVRWSFTQKKYGFLVDYLVRYVNNLASSGSTPLPGRDGGREVLILAPGREALLRAGIARWSFKVARFLRSFEELRKRVLEVRSRFLTPNQAAKRLHVDGTTVWRWCKLGFVKCIRVRGASSKIRGYRCLIPVEEVQRLGQENVKMKDGLAYHHFLLARAEQVSVFRRMFPESKIFRIH